MNYESQVLKNISEMKISVVIPTRNRVDKLKQCLSYLMPQLKKGDEVIVVDNASTDNTIEFLRRSNSEYVKVLEEKRLGSSYARNLAVKEAKGEILGFLDDDSFVLKGWVDSVRRLCQGSGSGYVYQGYIFHKFDDHNFLSDYFFYSRLNSQWKMIWERSDWKRDRVVSYINACNFFMSRKLLRRLEYLFDEELFPFVGEERDLAERLKLDGIVIRHTCSAGIIHSKSKASFSRFVYRAIMDGRAEGILEKKYKVSRWKYGLFKKQIREFVDQSRYRESWISVINMIRPCGLIVYFKGLFYVLLHQLLFRTSYNYTKLIYTFRYKKLKPQGEDFGV